MVASRYVYSDSSGNTVSKHAGLVWYMEVTRPKGNIDILDNYVNEQLQSSFGPYSLCLPPLE